MTIALRQQPAEVGNPCYDVIPEASVSPILVRPIREQIQHDRVVREIQARWRRRFTIEINPGQEENASVKAGVKRVFPDLVLTSVSGGRRLHGIVEVETIESVNHLEAMSEWAELARVRGAFYLYVPAGKADVTRRLCEGNHIAFAEIWTFYSVGREMRFSMVHQSKLGVRLSKARKATKERLKSTADKKSSSRKVSSTKTTKKKATADKKSSSRKASSAKSTKKKATAAKKSISRKTSSTKNAGTKVKVGAKTAKRKSAVTSPKKRTKVKPSHKALKSAKTRKVAEKADVSKSSVKSKKTTKRVSRRPSGSGSRS